MRLKGKIEDQTPNKHMNQFKNERPHEITVRLAEWMTERPSFFYNLISMFHFKWNNKIHVLFTRYMFCFKGSMFQSTDPCSMHNIFATKKHGEIKPHAFYTSFSFQVEK